MHSIEKRVSKDKQLPPSTSISVEILQSVVGDETDYVINLSTKSRCFWSVSYRFTYFRVLREYVEANVHTEFQAVFPGVFPLSWIMNMQQAQLETRQQQLWEWITELLSKYSQFSRTVQEAVSAFFNGVSPEHRIETYLLPPNPKSADDLCDRCYVSATIVDLKDHPIYIVKVNSVWRHQWDIHYRFNSFRTLYTFIVERFPKMICFEFPRTHKRSSYGMKLPVKDLVERHVQLKFWLCDAVACYPLFPEEIQEEMCLFFEGHPKYEPIQIVRKDKTGETIKITHSTLEGRFSMCTNPVSGVDMLLDDYGLSDTALEATDGRQASTKLLDIVAFLQLPDDVAFEITRYSAVQSKIIFADQLLKWADLKAGAFDSAQGGDLTAEQEEERDQIEAAVEKFYECVYRVSILPDDDQGAVISKERKISKATSPGNSLYMKVRQQEYAGCQLIAGKIASAFQALPMVQDAVYTAAYECLEKILDSGAPLASYSIIGGKKNSAASVRTATCVSLLGEVSTIGPHLPFIDNAESVFKKLLGGDEDTPMKNSYPASVKYVAAVMKQLMESEKIRVGTETSSQQLQRTKSQIEQAEHEYRQVLSRQSPSDAGQKSETDASMSTPDSVHLGGSVLDRQAMEALFQVLSVGGGPPARRSTMAATESSPWSPPRQKASRRLSADDNTLLRLAHYGANADRFSSGELNRARSESIEQDLAASPTPTTPPRSRKPFNISPVPYMADLPRPSLVSPKNQKRGSLKDEYHNELQTAFDYLVRDEMPDADSGEKRLSLQSILEWDQVQAVLSNGELTAADVTAEFHKSATAGFFGGESTIDFEAFCNLMEALESANKF